MTQYDAFDEKFNQALRSDEMPSADFTRRVMAQVAQTPQDKSVSSKRTWKIVLTAAACLAVVCVAIPMVFFGNMRAGSAAPESADCAAPAAAEDCAEEEVANTFLMKAEEAPAESADAAYGAATNESDVDSSASPQETEVMLSDTVLCQQARELAEELGAEGSDGRYYFTAEQAEVLRQAIPALKLPDGGFVLVLEG